MFFFASQIYLRERFIRPEFFTLTKNLNNA